MKKLLTFLLIFCAILPCSILLTGCDLSHKHYCDKYGYCKSCNTDTSVTLTLSGTQYTGKELYIKANDFGYFKFVANGEEYLHFVTSGVAIFTFEIYTKTSTSFYHVSGNNYTEFTYNYTFTKGETYYIKVKAKTDGTLTIKALLNI